MGKLVGQVTDFVGLTDIKGTQERSAQAAAQQSAAAREAAEMARFKPYNVRTALGGVNFGDQTVDIQYDPALAAYRQALFGLAPSLLPSDFRAAEEAEYQRNIAASQRMLNQSASQLGTNLFRTGRAGLDIFGSQPELRAFSQAVMDQERAARQQATAKILSDIAASESLFKAGVGVEQALLQPLFIGEGLGKSQSQAGAAAGQMLGSGLQQAAQTQLAGAQAASNQLTGFMNQMLSSAIGGFSGGGMGSMGGMQARFAQTSLGRSGFGTGLAYGNQDYGMYF